MKYRITRGGRNFGTQEGETRAEAFGKMIAELMADEGDTEVIDLLGALCVDAFEIEPLPPLPYLKERPWTRDRVQAVLDGDRRLTSAGEAADGAMQMIETRKCFSLDHTLVTIASGRLHTIIHNACILAINGYMVARADDQAAAGE